MILHYGWNKKYGKDIAKMKSLAKALNAVCIDDKLIKRADCNHCSVRKMMLFSKLDIDKASQLLWPIQNQRSPAKTLLYLQGQPPHSLISIRRGFIKLTQSDKNGQERIVRLLGPGASAGLETLLEKPYMQTAEAITELDYCIIPVRTVLQLEQSQPILYKELQNQWQMQLKQADDWLSKLLMGTVKQRFCRFLLMQYDTQKLPHKQIYLISNQDIASILATTEESVSRSVAELRKNGLLERIERRLYRLDLAAIEKLANF